MKITLPPLITLQRLSWQSVLIGLCLVAGYLNVMLVLQHAITINVGQGWDGYYYYRMAAHADLDDIYYPLWLRYGLPWLAGVFPTHDILLNFKIINLACALLYAACCYFLLVRCSANMHPAVPVIGWCLVCASNLAPIPSILWYPIQTDVVCSLFALVFLMMIITGRIPLWIVALLFFIGTTVRENFPEFLIYSLLRVNLSYNRNQTIRSNLLMLANKNQTVFAIIITGLLASFIGLYSIFWYTGRNPFEDKLSFMLETASNYISSPVHLLAVATNSISAILFIYMASVRSRITVKYSEHLFGLPFAKPIIILLSFIAVTGGTNPERYWYWAMPFFVLCMLPAINSLIDHKRYLLLGVCLLWALFIQRALVPIDAAGIEKDCDLLAILTGHSNWIGHWADQCSSLSQKHLVAFTAVIATVIWRLAGANKNTSHIP